MKFDASVPAPLKSIQEWFGSIIGRPVDENSRMNPVSPSGVPMEVEACQYIVPSPTLRPAQRIQIYNQQYWWRLLSAMHENFPLVTRLFGYFDFNQLIAIPYLVKYPPNHWSLGLLGDRLLKWVEEDYEGVDKPLILNAVKVDWSFTHCFISGSLPPIDLASLPKPGDLSSILNEKLCLQPHVHLFELPYDLFQFRIEFLQKEPEYWLENDFPPLPHIPEGEFAYFVLYRVPTCDVMVQQISKCEYLILSQFQKGSSIDDICEWLEEQEENLSNEASEKLHTWFQNWTMNRLLTRTL